MTNLLEYKGYFGTIEYSKEDGVLFGHLLVDDACASYEGSTLEELLGDFHDCVDDYLEGRDGRKPDDSPRFTQNVALPSQLFKSASQCAASRSLSMNTFIEDAIAKAVAAG